MVKAILYKGGRWGKKKAKPLHPGPGRGNSMLPLPVPLERLIPRLEREVRAECGQQLSIPADVVLEVLSSIRGAVHRNTRKGRIRTLFLVRSNPFTTASGKRKCLLVRVKDAELDSVHLAPAREG